MTGPLIVPAEVWYHGAGHGAGPRPIVIENAAGDMLGVVNHVPKHSPAGMGWGYAGSGPADCARSLLIAVLGDDARCEVCGGAGQIVYPIDDERPVTQPFQAGKPVDEYFAGRPVEVSSCWADKCDEGCTVMPSVYQAFKFQFVATWGPEWRISRAEILAWLATQPEWPR